MLEQLRGAALIEVRLVTGKRNQIRIQAGLRGHPLAGEQKYVFGAAPGRPSRSRGKPCTPTGSPSATRPTAAC